MPRYRRTYLSGGKYFFTVVTYQRRPILTTDTARRVLRDAMTAVRSLHPFEIDAMVLLPDHLHAIWPLPPDDSDYSGRWGRIKELFTRSWLIQGGRNATVSESKANERRRGIWQPRFWEHRIRNDQDYSAHMDYIHYNPVKHGLALCPHEWLYSTFHRCVEEKRYRLNWMCRCDERVIKTPKFESIQSSVGE